jgi:penicillin-binding protein 2
MGINRWFKKRNSFNQFVEPDEIFLDAKNLPQFDTQQFEGRIEKAIPKKTIFFIGVFFIFILVVFAFRVGSLQIKDGEYYLAQSLNNSLDKEPIFAERGIIYDRNGVEIAWNDSADKTKPFAERVYLDNRGFSHVLGYVSYPLKDKAGFYWQSEYVGKDGVEKVYDEMLKGQNGVRLIEKDVYGNVKSSNMTNQPIQGENLHLTIDAKLQEEFFKQIKDVADKIPYQGGAAVIIDVKTGELLVLTSYPEYDSTIISLGKDKEIINSYFTSKRKPFLNRAIGGIYAPGSIVKPYIALGALTEGVVTPNTKILSNNQITIPNPYNPTQSAVFRDYRDNNGWVDLRQALSVSSNIYFYNVGGGYKDQKGIGINNIKKYTEMFGLGQKTNIKLLGEKDGNIPDPVWKAKVFSGDPWRIGDTYNTSIGQYGFQVTPIQMARAVASIANGGYLLTPRITNLQDEFSSEKIPIEESYFQVVREGMRMVATEGTAASYKNLPFSIAIKTGTAQVGARNEYINSWATGFFPYEEPRYAFAIIMDRAPVSQYISAQTVARYFFEWLYANYPEYTKPI